MKKILFIAFLTVLLAQPVFAALKMNDAAPVFSLPDLGEKRFSLGDVVGGDSKEKSNGVVLSFFASWCLPCRDELPIINSLFDELNAKGIRVVLIGVRDDFNRIKALLTELKVDKPIVVSDREGKVAEMYQVRFLPTTFFVGCDGKVKDIIFGGISDQAELRKSAGKLVK